MKDHTHKEIHREGGERGVALLFVVLLTSVLFLVAIGISNIAYKEVVFSIQANDSDIAFFAADTGIECGLYLYKEDTATFVSGASVSFPSGVPVHATCNNISPLSLVGAGAGTSNFAVSQTKQCADVTVDVGHSHVVDSGGAYVVYPSGHGALTGTPEYYTIITSRGYNVGKTSTSGSGTCFPSTSVPVNLINRTLQTQFVPGL